MSSEHYLVVAVTIMLTVLFSLLILIMWKFHNQRNRSAQGAGRKGFELLASPGRKSRLQEEASHTKISVGELIRQRIGSTPEESDLAVYTAQLRKATAEAHTELALAVTMVETVVDALQKRRKEVELYFQD